MLIDRQQDILGAARAAHQDTDRNADHGGERKAGDEPHQRIECMVRQCAIQCQPHEGRGDSFQRRK